MAIANKSLMAAMKRFFSYTAYQFLQTMDFLEHDFLHEQIESIKQLGDYVRQLKNLHETNPGLGEHIFDRDLK